MRRELIHFLSQVKNEQTMLAMIRNLDADSFHTLLHCLEFTSPDTKARWLAQVARMLR